MCNTYIHYGSNQFEHSLFCPIRNIQYSNKPNGGLWASPIDAEYGWKEWCNDNSFRECKEDVSFKFVLADSSRVIHIRSYKDIDELPLFPKQFGWALPDFEKAYYLGIDAIELHLSEDESPDGMNGLYWLLYGWDCDSILILNPKIVIPI